MLKLLIVAVAISVTAYVYKNILLHEKIMNWFAKIGDRYEEKWFYKPIWGCAMCFSGQLALWTFIINCLYWCEIPIVSNFLRFVVPIFDNEQINVLNGLLFICVTIFTTKLLNDKI